MQPSHGGGLKFPHEHGTDEWFGKEAHTLGKTSIFHPEGVGLGF
jgi:hypothetical protein